MIGRSHHKLGHAQRSDPVCLGCNQSQHTRFRWKEVSWDR